MTTFLQTFKDYVLEHKKEFIRGGVIILSIAVILLGLALYSYNTSKPKIVYEPAVACNLLTLDEAKEFLGDATINGVKGELTQVGDVVTSRCGYSDGKADTANAVVIAIAVRSGINDKGIEQNKTQFNNGMPTSNVEIIKDVGDSAYFNKTTGQLNILKQSTWVLLSYGPGASSASNTIEDAVKLADKVLK